MTFTIAPVFASADAIAPAFIESIKTCKPYSGSEKEPLMETIITRRIYGIQNNSCIYKEGSAVDGKTYMECRYPVSMLGAISKHYMAINKSSSSSFHTTINFSENGASANTKYTLDDKPIDNPLQYAIDKGYCQFK